MRFEVVASDGAARCGRLTTAHGVVETPVFMPVGTRGAVRSLAPDDLRAAGAQLVLANTYRSEEHTSELQSHSDLVCRLLLEKKKKNTDALSGDLRQPA